jgi:hypothetical protein
VVVVRFWRTRKGVVAALLVYGTSLQIAARLLGVSWWKLLVAVVVTEAIHGAMKEISFRHARWLGYEASDAD